MKFFDSFDSSDEIANAKQEDTIILPYNDKTSKTTIADFINYIFINFPNEVSTFITVTPDPQYPIIISPEPTSSSTTTVVVEDTLHLKEIPKANDFFELYDLGQVNINNPALLGNIIKNFDYQKHLPEQWTAYDQLIKEINRLYLYINYTKFTNLKFFPTTIFDPQFLDEYRKSVNAVSLLYDRLSDLKFMSKVIIWVATQYGDTTTVNEVQANNTYQQLKDSTNILISKIKDDYLKLKNFPKDDLKKFELTEYFPYRWYVEELPLFYTSLDSLP
jgi:hypothetical protein